jgi:hypothetical protein
MPYSYVDGQPTIPISGQVLGTATGTFIPFSSLPCTSIHLIAHPSNSGIAWIISQNGAIGYPLKANQPGLYLDSVSDMGTLRGWFETAGDKICYLVNVNTV